MKPNIKSLIAIIPALQQAKLQQMQHRVLFWLQGSLVLQSLNAYSQSKFHLIYSMFKFGAWLSRFTFIK